MDMLTNYVFIIPVKDKTLTYEYICKVFLLFNLQHTITIFYQVLQDNTHQEESLSPILMVPFPNSEKCMQLK